MDLQIEYLIAGWALCLFFSGLANYVDWTNGFAHRAHASCYVFWPGANNLLGLSTAHRQYSTVHIIKSKPALELGS